MLSLILPLPWLLLLKDDPFFWDTVQLASKHAHHFYEQGLRWTVLPSEIDSGHPPFFGYYLAVCWTLFGKTLFVSHLAMWPFLSGLIYVLFRIGQRIVGYRLMFFLPLLAFADPVISTQAALVSPDIVLLFFFMLAIEGVLTNRPVWLALGITGLCLISMRGMMTTAAIFIWVLVLTWLSGPRTLRRIWQQAVPFLPGGLAGIWFLAWPHGQTGWTGFHPDSPWSPAFDAVGLSGMLRNSAVVAWRWLDLGRCFEWLVLGVLAWNWRKGGGALPRRDLLLLFGVLLLTLSPSAILYHNLSAHRYFLPAYMALHLIVFSWICSGQRPARIMHWMLAIAISGLAAGHLWVYPAGISMDWDSTLAHRSYHPLREEMCQQLDIQNIPWTKVGSAFPNLNTGEHLKLNGDQRMFSEFSTRENQYVLVSNVFNDLEASDFQLLKEQWILEKHLQRGSVWMSLYRKP